MLQEISTQQIWFRYFCKIENGYWIYSDGSHKGSDNSLLRVDDEFNVIDGAFSQKIFPPTTIHSTFVQSENQVFFISPYSNVFCQIKNDSVIPYISINFDNHTLPYQEISRMTDEMEYNKLIEKGDYVGYLGDFVLCGGIFYFTFSEMSGDNAQYIACYNLDKEKTHVYNSYTEYYKPNFPFKHLSLAQPKTSFRGEFVYLVDAFDFQDEDLQELEKYCNWVIGEEMNPVLFFMKKGVVGLHE